MGRDKVLSQLHEKYCWTNIYKQVCNYVSISMILCYCPQVQIARLTITKKKFINVHLVNTQFEKVLLIVDFIQLHMQLNYALEIIQPVTGMNGFGII